MYTQTNYEKIEGNSCILKFIQEENIPIIYNWDCDLSVRHFWHSFSELEPFFIYKNRFFSDFKRNYHQFFMICDKNSQEKFVGFIYSAKYDRENGHLDISIYIDYEYRKGLMAAEVGILFCDYLFKNYPIRKIYLSSYSDNITSLEFSKSAGFSEEGRLIKHKYFNGKYHDLITLGLFRENFYQILENIIKKL